VIELVKSLMVIVLFASSIGQLGRLELPRKTGHKLKQLKILQTGRVS
jgi:hypothetical protein